MGDWSRPYAARNATTFNGTASLKLDSDPLGSQFLNDPAEAVEREEVDGRLVSPELIRIQSTVRADGGAFS